MGWPQALILVILGLKLWISMTYHGQRINGKYNFWLQLTAAILTAWILYEGGFWNGV